MTANNLLMQFLADVLDVPVVRPIVAETVSLGAAYAAGLGRRASGPTSRACARTGTRPPSGARTWTRQQREKGYRKWRKAVERATDWIDEDDD